MLQIVQSGRIKAMRKEIEMLTAANIRLQGSNIRLENQIDCLVEAIRAGKKCKEEEDGKRS